MKAAMVATCNNREPLSSCARYFSLLSPDKYFS